jgi:two-component system, OmpR family, sensor histidine kinase KdpD
MRPKAAAAAGKPYPAKDWVVVFGLLAAATLAGLVLDGHVSLTSHAMLYVLAVVMASYRLAWVPSFFCAFAAVLLLNFFFIPPRFTFQVEARENLIALATMFVVALVISHLGTALRRETQAARLNERRARELQELATGLAGSQSSREVVAIGLAALQGAFEGPCTVALLTETGELDLAPAQAATCREGMLCCIKEAGTLGPGTGRWPGLDAWYIPLGEKGRMSGAVCIQNVSPYDHSGREYAQALCTLIGQALRRLQLTASMEAARQESQWHMVQSTFLAAISHDLRTPLAAIMGAASSLQTQRDKLGPAEQERLVASILSESRYLSTLTENTLQLVRLGNSARLDLDWVAMEEVVGAVLARVRQRDPARRIRSRVPSGLPLIKADPVLLAQLLENLLDNALKYSTDGIDLVVTRAGKELQVAVEDRGSGIPEGAEQAIFEPYRRGDRSGQRGAGLGLAVCRAVAGAHGGSLTVQRREGGGSSFILALPVEEHQPEQQVAP